LPTWMTAGSDRWHPSWRASRNDRGDTWRRVTRAHAAPRGV
jgi:hypothetical protein